MPPSRKSGLQICVRLDRWPPLSLRRSSEREGPAAPPPPGSIREVPGSHGLNPLSELDAYRRVDDYVRAKQAEVGGAHVFRTYLGTKSIAITDMESARFFYSAPKTTLARDPSGRLGPSVGAYVGESFHMLTSVGTVHDNARRAHEDMLRRRDPTLWPALDEAFGRCVTRWREQPRTALNPLCHDLCLVSSFWWLFGVWIAPEHLREAAFHEAVYVDLTTDNPVINRTILPLIQHQRRPEVVAAREHFAELVARSPRYPEYLELARACEVPTRDYNHHLAATTLMNVATVARLTLFPLLAYLAVDPELLAGMRAELDGARLDRETLLRELPLLDAVYLEAKRLWPRPRLTRRVAQHDLLLPASDGYRYIVRKGEAIIALHPPIFRDPGVYGPTADRFRPQRFFDRPELKKVQDLSFAWARGANHNYYCSGMVLRHAELMLKYFIARFVRDLDWELDQPPAFSANFYNGVSPAELAVVGLRLRPAGALADRGTTT